MSASVKVYRASLIKRRRATAGEMDDRAEFLIAYAMTHAPVTVRQLFYAAVVASVAGIDKTEAGYNKVQAQVLDLRRARRLPYHCIADATRYMRRPTTFDGWQDALQSTAQFYRKSLWADRDEEVELWLEKSALAGVLSPVTEEFDVPLMPTSGYTSETFAWEAVTRLVGTGRKLVVYSLYDFDRSGRDAERSLQEKVERFGSELNVAVSFHSLGLSFEQVRDWRLPTRPPKRATVADARWPYEFAAELDAIPPDDLRALVRAAIEQHLPADELQRLLQIEEMERETLHDFLEWAA